MKKTMHDRFLHLYKAHGNSLKTPNMEGEFVKRTPTFSLRRHTCRVFFLLSIYSIERESSMHNNHLISVTTVDGVVMSDCQLNDG